MPNDMDEEKRPIPWHKGRKKIQTIVARIRTRLCTLPRGNVCRVPDETWANMCRTFLIMRRREHMRDLPSHVDCYHHVLIHAPHPPITPFQSDVLQTDQAELTTGEMHLRLCLVPHFDYSFNLNMGVSCGKHLLAEHTFVVSYVFLIFSTMWSHHHCTQDIGFRHTRHPVEDTHTNKSH